MNETLYKWISSVNRNVKRGLGTQGQVEELWVDSAKVTNLDDPEATRKSAIQAAKERGCEYNSSIQGTVFYYTMPWHNYPQNYEKSFQTEKWAKLWHQRMLVRPSRSHSGTPPAPAREPAKWPACPSPPAACNTRTESGSVRAAASAGRPFFV
jgi:hypothetical protein